MLAHIILHILSAELHTLRITHFYLQQALSADSLGVVRALYCSGALELDLGTTDGQLSPLVQGQALAAEAVALCRQLLAENLQEENIAAFEGTMQNRSEDGDFVCALKAVGLTSTVRDAARKSLRPQSVHLLEGSGVEPPFGKIRFEQYFSRPGLSLG